MQKRRMILISVVLITLTGVDMADEGQGVDKLKATNNESDNLGLVKENTLTGERGDEQAWSVLYLSYFTVHIVTIHVKFIL